MTLLAVASFLAFGALLVLYGLNASELIASLGLRHADLGLLGSFLSLGLGIGIVVAGPLIDRLPRRPLFVAACALVALACGLLGPSTGFRALLVHTFAIGFGAGFYETILNALVVERLGTDAPRRLLFVHSAATLAAGATPLAVAGLRASFSLPWYDTFRIAGGIHVLLMAAAFLAPSAWTSHARADDAPEKRPLDRPDGSSATSARPRSDRVALAAVCIATFAYVGVESALTLFVGDHSRTTLGLEAERSARTISAFWSGLLVGRLAVGLRLRAPGAGTIAALASVATLVVFAFGLGRIAHPELAMALAGFFLGGVFPVMIGLAGQTLPQRAGLAVGLAGGLGSLGGFAVPWLTGGLAETAGLPTALAALAGWLGILVVSAAAAGLRLAPAAGTTRPKAG